MLAPWLVVQAESEHRKSAELGPGNSQLRDLGQGLQTRSVSVSGTVLSTEVALGQCPLL